MKGLGKQLKGNKPDGASMFHCSPLLMHTSRPLRPFLQMLCTAAVPSSCVCFISFCLSAMFWKTITKWGAVPESYCRSVDSANAAALCTNEPFLACRYKKLIRLRCKVPAALVGMQEGQTVANAAAQAGQQSCTDVLVTHAGKWLGSLVHLGRCRPGVSTQQCT